MPIKYFIAKSSFREGEYFARTLRGDVFTIEDAISNILGSLGVCMADVSDSRTCSGFLRDTPNKLGSPAP